MGLIIFSETQSSFLLSHFHCKITAAEIAEDEITEEDERFVYTNDLLCTFVNSGEDNQEEA